MPWAWYRLNTKNVEQGSWTDLLIYFYLSGSQISVIDRIRKDGNGPQPFPLRHEQCCNLGCGDVVYPLEELQKNKVRIPNCERLFTHDSKSELYVS